MLRKTATALAKGFVSDEQAGFCKRFSARDDGFCTEITELVMELVWVVLSWLVPPAPPFGKDNFPLDGTYLCKGFRFQQLVVNVFHGQNLEAGVVLGIFSHTGNL